MHASEIRSAADRLLTRRPRQSVFVLLTLCVPVSLYFSWQVVNLLEESRARSAVQGLRTQNSLTLNHLSGECDHLFQMAREVPQFIAEMSAVAEVLESAHDEKAVEALNKTLADVSSRLDLGVVWLMDADGHCRAAGNAGQPDSLVRADCSDRQYFIEAMQGRIGRQFAVGRRTHQPGFYFATPVRKEGKIIGAVGSMVSIEQLKSLLALHNSFLSDAYGVILTADDNALTMHALPGATVMSLSEKERQARYGRSDFSTLPLSALDPHDSPGLVRVGADGRTAVLQSAWRPAEGLTLHVLTNIEAGRTSQADKTLLQFFIFAGSLGASWAMLVSLVYGRTLAGRNRVLAEANRSLTALNAELAHQAQHDPLTGCANRRRFKTAAAAEILRCKRYGSTFSLAVLDIDNFKRVNDTFGHDVGDKALKTLSRTIAAMLRRTDLLARQGGEEFLILMPETRPEDGATLMRRILDKVRVMPVTLEKECITISFSAGVSGYRPDVSLRRLVREADESMYRAKQAGRNRVEINPAV